MGLKYGFFNSVGGDRKYNAEDMSKYFDKIVSDGVFHDPSNALQVVANSGFTVSVSAGRGLIACRWLQNDSLYNLTVEPSHVILDRIDRVVMRLDLNESSRKMELAIIKGTPSDNPVLPILSNDDLITELTLCTIFIGHGETSISQSDITDRRADEGFCGWVHSLISAPPTGNALKRYQSHFVLDSDTSDIMPNIPQYHAGDILYIYSGGVMLTDGVDYTVSGTGSAAVVHLTNYIQSGSKITCILLTTD